MANQEHLDILKQGVEAWNQWRKQHRDARINLSGAALDGAQLEKVNLSNANLFEASFISAKLYQANFSYADCRGAKFHFADLMDADLRHAVLRRAEFSSANLRYASLDEADLREADLSDAKLHLTVLNGANLNGADFFRTDLRVVSLDGADLSHARFNLTVITGTDLSTAQGLEEVEHLASSSIGLDTIYSSMGCISEFFLRGIGVPEPFIANMHTLIEAMKPIDYYTCFLSYSSQDQIFAEKLYASLQESGVRCWFAPEDLKIGDRFHSRIDEAIHLQDKLLLLLSVSAIHSDWVEIEARAALEKEHRQHRDVLFPIRLDSSVMETSQAWAAMLRRNRHIGDFTNWTDPQAYQIALKRLLADLKKTDEQRDQEKKQ